MKIGVISDIHGNIVALKECIKYFESQGCDEYMFLGDLVSDVCYTRETLDFIYSFMNNHICHILRGNREEYMIAQREVISQGKTEAMWRKNSASGNLLFCYEQLSDKDIDFFENLPKAFIYHKEGYPDIVCAHGSPDNTRELLQLGGDNTKNWLKKIDKDYLICGHTHYPGRFEYDKKCYYNSGSVGISINDAGYAQCMMLESCLSDGMVIWKPQFLKIPYDNVKVAKDMKACGMLDYGKWFVNSNLLTILTGNDLSYDMLISATEIAKQKGKVNAWPDVDEECFEEAAQIAGIPDYRVMDLESET